jgi:hypothetical protein
MIVRPRNGEYWNSKLIVLILDKSLWMDKATLICDCAIRADEDVIRDHLAEDFNLEDVRDDFLRLSINVWVRHSRYM